MFRAGWLHTQSETHRPVRAFLRPCLNDSLILLLTVFLCWFIGPSIFLSIAGLSIVSTLQSVNMSPSVDCRRYPSWTHACTGAWTGIWHNALTSVVSRGRWDHNVYSTICRVTGGSSLSRRRQLLLSGMYSLLLTSACTSIPPPTCTIPRNSFGSDNRGIGPTPLLTKRSPWH